MDYEIVVHCAVKLLVPLLDHHRGKPTLAGAACDVFLRLRLIGSESCLTLFNRGWVTQTLGKGNNYECEK